MESTGNFHSIYTYMRYYAQENICQRQRRPSKAVAEQCKLWFCAEEMSTYAEESLSIKQKLPSCNSAEIPNFWSDAQFPPQLLTGDLLWSDLQPGWHWH